MKRAIWITIILLIAGYVFARASGIIRSHPFETTINDTAGNAATIASASPPAAMIALPDSETEPFFVAPSANDALVGPYGLYTSPAVDNLVQRASFETCDGSDHPVGWVVAEVSGSGTAELSCSTTHKTHGSGGIAATVTALDGHVGLNSACFPVDDTKAYQARSFIYGSENDENVYLDIFQYSGADCTSLISSFSCVPGVDVPTGWSDVGCQVSESGGASPAWDATAVSVKIAFYPNYRPSASTTVYADVVEFWQGHEKDSVCACDTDASCSCSNVIASIGTPVSSGTWQLEAEVRSPMDGAVGSPYRWIFHTPGTSPTYKNRIVLYWGSDLLRLEVFNSDDVDKTASVSAPGDADTSYKLKAYHTDTGRIGVCWDGVCGTENTGATMDSIHATSYIGSKTSTGDNIHIKDVTWRRRLTEPLGTTP